MWKAEEWTTAYRARSWDIATLTREAEAGNCAAQATLGIAYLFGRDSIEINYAAALRFLSAAANRGASRAITNLAYMYEEGLGVPRDVVKAIDLYGRVAHVEFFAAIALGRLYSRGLAVSADHDQAVRWYTVAAGFQKRIADCDELTEAGRYISGK